MSGAEFERHLALSSREAEGRAANSYHCATPDCAGWCTHEDDVNSFFCYRCSRDNCLTCRAVHEGQNCAEYQRELRDRRRAGTSAEDLSLDVSGCSVVRIRG